MVKVPVGSFLGLSANTWTIIGLIAGWLVVRALLQFRISARHQTWLEARKQRREEILGAGSRDQIPCKLEDIPGLAMKRYAALAGELQALGFRGIGAFEDVRFNEAFPHLRMAYDVHLSNDGMIVATVAIMEERRLWRRLVLKVRGVAACVESVQLATSWADGLSVVTQRTTAAQVPGGGGTQAGEGSGPKVIRQVRPGTESMAEVLRLHREQVKQVGGDKDPLRFAGLDEVLRHGSSHK
jgi:hypothetical protein